MMKRASYLILTTTLGLAACGGIDARPDGAGEPSPSWQEVARAELGEAGSICMRRTLTEDLYLGAVDAHLPGSVDYAVLRVGEPTGPDGTGPCNDAEQDARVLHAASAAGDAFYLPETVALYAPAGSQLVWQVEASEAAGSVADDDTVVLRGLRIASDEVTAVADALPLGTAGTGTWTLAEDQFLFAVTAKLPPAHRMTLTADSSFSGPVTLFDSSDELASGAPALLAQPVPMRAGERIGLACSLVVPTQTGASANDPCLAVVYRFPAPDAP